MSEFCKSVRISRSLFYKIRSCASTDSTAALHPRSRTSKDPARGCGLEGKNDLLRIRKERRDDGWDYGPWSVHYEAALSEDFPGEQVPSVAAFARQLAIGRYGARRSRCRTTPTSATEHIPQTVRARGTSIRERLTKVLLDSIRTAFSLKKLALKSRSC